MFIIARIVYYNKNLNSDDLTDVAIKIKNIHTFCSIEHENVFHTMAGIHTKLKTRLEVFDPAKGERVPMISTESVHDIQNKIMEVKKELTQTIIIPIHNNVNI